MNAGGACRAPLQTGQPPAERGGCRLANAVRQQEALWQLFIKRNRRIPLSGYHRLGRGGPGGQAVCRYPRGILQQFRRVWRPHVREELCGGKGRRAWVGVYYYIGAQTESYADRELEALTAVLAGKKLEYPVFVDMEVEGIAALGRARATQLALYALENSCGGVASGPATPIPLLRKTGWIWRKLSAYPFLYDYTGSVTYPGAYQMWQADPPHRRTGYIGQCGLTIRMGFSAGHSGGRLQWL